MQTPVEIDFQGMSGTPEVHASIEKHVAGSRSQCWANRAGGRAPSRSVICHQ